MNDTESLLQPIQRESLKLCRPFQPIAQAHPPSVCEPEEWRAISVPENSFATPRGDRALCQQRVVAAIGRDQQPSLLPMQSTIGCFRAACFKFVFAGIR
jgi:hypothetical protein